MYFATSSGGITDNSPDFGDSKQMSPTSVAFFATTAICSPGGFAHSRTPPPPSAAFPSRDR
ncbi:hypothetical protein [Streptomyces sp. TLI_185]|uniref:hypothetical protein n=1 Tax=Streptomyces sp. TLI_185 TaxID=2485151 RepID=UPI000F4EA6FA|nr:hypothetical protein [Streptomyces sp. TLI_185]